MFHLTPPVFLPLMAVVILVSCTLRAVAADDGITAARPENLPANYQLLYEGKFDHENTIETLVMTDPGAWRINNTTENRTALELAKQSSYKPPFRSPVNVALIADRQFGDFVLEADLLQTGKEYGHRDMCLFFGFESPSRFYYAHMATVADKNAHNIFVVNEAPRTNIAKETTSGVEWGDAIWHHVRLEREVGSGRIRLFFDDMSKPIMVAEDRSFGAGHIGFGSFDDTGLIDNVRIWGPAMESKETGFFIRQNGTTR